MKSNGITGLGINLRHDLWLVALWGAVVIAGVNYLRLSSHTPAIPLEEGKAGPVVAQVLRRVTPYTSVLGETLRSRAGDRETGVEVTEAVRSDGSFMRRVERLGRAEAASSTQQSTRLILLSTGQRVVTNDLRELKSTTVYPLGMIAASIRDSRTGCVTNMLGRPYAPDMVKLGEESIGGQTTVKVRFSGVTAWFAPGVGCAQLRLLQESEPGNWNEQSLLALRAGDPDPVLFLVPEHYVEVQPSTLYRMNPDSDAARRMDARYASERPK